MQYLFTDVLTTLGPECCQRIRGRKGSRYFRVKIDARLDATYKALSDPGRTPGTWQRCGYDTGVTVLGDGERGWCAGSMRSPAASVNSHRKSEQSFKHFQRTAAFDLNTWIVFINRGPMVSSPSYRVPRACTVVPGMTNLANRW